MAAMPPRDPAIDRRPDAPPADGAAETVAPAGLADAGSATQSFAGLFPIQSAKVQQPPLRDSTLTRDRLIEWLRGNVHHRVILVTAEAGYGKTTLLADFSRRSRHRTLWYRLDEGDQSWAGLLSYLIAAGREFLPGFGSVTSSLLAQIGPDGPSRDSAVDTFMRELGALGDERSVLVIDDVHLVDHADDVSYMLKTLVERMPARMTLVLVSRRPPNVALGRLRGQGEVAELTGADLRFDDGEIEQLFRDSYRQPLEPDLLREIAHRTEGWAASLELVHTAVRDRPSADVRALIGELSGSRGEVYDYLAEEVIGELPDALQRFLMRSSILETLDEDIVAVVTNLERDAIRRRMAEIERLGLITRREPRGRPTHRLHPLVREFLTARLLADIGDEALRELHTQVAKAVEQRDWATACRHFAAAGDNQEIARVVEASISRIMATGDYAQAASIIEHLAPQPAPASFDIIRSRMALRRGDVTAGIQSATDAADRGDSAEAAQLNLASILISSGKVEEALKTARGLDSASTSERVRGLARALVLIIESSVRGDVAELAAVLGGLADEHSRLGNLQFAATANLNGALTLRVMGRAEEAARRAEAALAAYLRTDTTAERVSARLAYAWAQAHLGEIEVARRAYREALREAVGRSQFECITEGADLETWYGDRTRALELLAMRDPGTDLDSDMSDAIELSRLQHALQTELEPELERATESLRVGGLSAAPGQDSRRRALRAHSAIVLGQADANALVRQALAQAEAQSADFWVAYCRLLDGYVNQRSTFRREVTDALDRHPVFCSILAELIVRRMCDLEPQTIALLQREIEKRAERWLPALRRELETRGSSSSEAAATLDLVGTKDDVQPLRSFAREHKVRGRRSYGLSLARRLADRVFVEDQGRVVLHVGERSIFGTEVRRKVLALLCFLLSRPGRSATRDEVLDALWPDLEPAVALNSLNQTIYFLRRVFEPGYKEQTSPGYVHHESDIVWLDDELIDSRSVTCRRLLASAVRDRSRELVDRLSELYIGKFALDFAYEEWATAYRDSMHASYLQVIETAIASDLDADDYQHGIALARRAVEVDPNADELHVALLRLYRGLGATAAAAEQYAHYASMLRDGLGIEPPGPEELWQR